MKWRTTLFRMHSLIHFRNINEDSRQVFIIGNPKIINYEIRNQQQGHCLRVANLI
jgi:hypothetical protein